MTRAPSGAATAALCLGATLLLRSGIGALGGTADVACERPGEVASERGWTTAVECRAGLASGEGLRGPARLLFGLTLDLNRADAEALEVLPSIGPRRAAAIVRARREAAFSSVEELARVRGIGPKTIEGLAAWVRVGAEAGGSP